MAEVEFYLHNEAGIQFPPLRPSHTDGELYFDRFRERVATGKGGPVTGGGGAGRILLVRDELMDREVALRILSDDVLRDTAAREDLIVKTRLAIGFSHPNIVRIHDFHEGDGKWGISMQYVRGKSLDELRQENQNSGVRRMVRPYTVAAIRDWISQLCDALSHIHEDAGSVHRDVNPGNLILEKRYGREKLYLMDSGISRSLGSHTTGLAHGPDRAGESAGDRGGLPYMSWQQISGAPASPLDDVYAVGATIYALLTGRAPFYDGDVEQIREQVRHAIPPSMGRRIEELGLRMPAPPAEWEQVVAKCLSKSPGQRPRSMRHLAEALGFQSGSHTGLEATVTSQEERIRELETRVAASDPGEAARLSGLQQQIARLESEIERSRAAQSDLTERLESSEAERDSAFQGTGRESPQSPEDSPVEMSPAMEKATRLHQQELSRARKDAAAQIEQSRRRVAELEIALRDFQHKDGAIATGETDPSMRPIAKAEPSSDELIRQIREEGEKRLQKQAGELETARMTLAALEHEKEDLERTVATEKERQRSSLKPLLVSLVIAMVVGLAGGYLSTLLRGTAAPALTQSQISYLPKDPDSVADKPVPFELFTRFTADLGVKVGDLSASDVDGAVQGVSGVTAMNFCNWLNQKYPPGKGTRYSLPRLEDLVGKVGAGKKEWSGEWDESRLGQVLKMCGGKNGDSEFYPVHIIQTQGDFTFRIRLERNSNGDS